MSCKTNKPNESNKSSQSTEPGRQDRSKKRHDGLMRRTFGVPKHAASLARSLLPAAVVERMDLDRISRESGDFIDHELQPRYSDLLFSVPLDGQDAFIYLLLEHQSGPDALMPYRMLRYMVRIWERYLNANPKVKRLPAVIPMVVHHNERAWTGPVALRDIITLDPDTDRLLGELVPQFQFLLDDLATIDDETLRERPMTHPARLTYVLFKTVPRNPDGFPDQLWSWIPEARELLDEPGGQEVFEALLTYIRNVSEAPNTDLDKWTEMIGPVAQETNMTITERIQTEARVEARAEMLLRQVEAKFGPVPQSVVQAVHDATEEQLDDWSIRVVTAETLEEVFR